MRHNQSAGIVDLMHGGQSQDLARRAGMKEDSLLCHGHGADQVFGDLDEDVFEGLVAVEGGRGRFLT